MPGVPVELDVELWPTSIVVPAGYRVALTVRGKDYEYGGGSGGRLSNFKNELKGCGPFLHDDPVDRPAGDFRWADHLALWREAAGLSPATCCAGEIVGCTACFQDANSAELHSCAAGRLARA